jgi:acetolactate synthase-1/2/3 large subunit
MRSINRKIVENIIEAGIDHAFIIPGGVNFGTPITSSLYDYKDKIKAILVRNEQTASCMAAMYGRLTGKPGLLIGQGPFVASLGLFGVMESYLTSTPMLTLTDVTEYGDLALHAPFQSGLGEYGCLDLKAIFKGTTKYVTVATSPLEAVQGVQLAIKHAVTGRPGPTACLLRSSAIKGELSDKHLARLHPISKYLNVEKPAASYGDVERVVGMLMEAKRPVIIAGNGVHASKAYVELAQLAEAAQIPVATSYQGKSSIPEVHPLALGVMNMYGEPVALQAISQADLLLVVGCRLKPQDTCLENPDLINPERQKIIQVDIDSRNVGWVFPVDIGLTGDAKRVMGQMIEVITERGKERFHRKEWLQAIGEMKRSKGFFDDPSMYSDQTPILSTRIVKELRDHLPPESIITLDGGNNRVSMLRYFQTRQAGTYYPAGGIGAMSMAPPSAIAAKLLFPQKPCVSVCGDGGMAMQIHALSTAKQYGAAAIFIVMNDSVLGAVRDGQKDRPIASEYIDTNFAEIARAFGCQGVRIKNPQEIAPALKEALQSREPFVIDILTDKDEQIRNKVRVPFAQKGLVNI